MAGKAQIVDRLVADGATRAQAAAAVDAVLDAITASLAAGERVTLTGFGTFEPAERSARTARNPRTGTAVEVAATTVARFRPGTALRAAVATAKDRDDPEGGKHGSAATGEAPAGAASVVTRSAGKAGKGRTKATAASGEDAASRAAASTKVTKDAEAKAKRKAKGKGKAKGKAKVKSKDLKDASAAKSGKKRAKT
ncbi:MAG: HU family DNA-binding protein [Cellulomonas sp.]|nr:HU family DNA-binding protein [Cellulomonas sp.]MBO9556374.1 HU family DNA-binding protein [Cellulomonas sp.]